MIGRWLEIEILYISYLCAYMHVEVNWIVQTDMRVCIFIYVHIYAYIYICTYMCMCICLYVDVAASWTTDLFFTIFDQNHGCHGNLRSLVFNSLSSSSVCCSLQTKVWVSSCETVCSFERWAIMLFALKGPVIRKKKKAECCSEKDFLSLQKHWARQAIILMDWKEEQSLNCWQDEDNSWGRALFTQTTETYG